MIEYARVKKIVDLHDPEGLLRLGAPNDEYDAEARMICDDLHSPPDGAVTQAWVRKAVSQVFRQQFGATVSCDAHYWPVADEIYATILGRHLDG